LRNGSAELIIPIALDGGLVGSCKGVRRALADDRGTPMAVQDDKEILDQSLEALAKGDEAATEEEAALFEQLAGRIEEPGLQDRILERYTSFGQDLLSDALPSRVDPRIAKVLEPILGDIGDVRVHTGPMATAAAQAMDARAFAVGDRDIFLDPAHLSSAPREAGALIAHEVAHTRDAATGFALSAKAGSDTSAREAFAHEVAHRFAQEWDDEGDSIVRGTDETSPVTGPDGMPGEPEIDRELLATKIVEALEKQDRSLSDRVGRW